MLSIVHPSEDERRRLGTLTGEMVEARMFESAETFLAQATSVGRGCVLVPSNLPEPGTRAFIETLCERNRAVRVVVLGCNGDVATAIELMRAGASEYLEPPVMAWRLRSAIQHALAP